MNEYFLWKLRFSYEILWKSILWRNSLVKEFLPKQSHNPEMKWGRGCAKSASSLCSALQRCGRSSFRQRWNWSTFLFPSPKNKSVECKHHRYKRAVVKALWLFWAVIWGRCIHCMIVYGPYQRRSNSFSVRPYVIFFRTQKEHQLHPLVPYSALNWSCATYFPLRTG